MRIRVGMLALLLCAAAGALEPKEIYDRAAPATVVVKTNEGYGSGFVLSVQEEYVVTNAHVVNGDGEISITTKDGKTLTAAPVAADADMDLALLRVKGLAKTDAKEIPLADSIRDGEAIKATRVYAIGHPADPTGQGSMWKFTRGVVANVRALALPDVKGLVLIEHDATLAGGSSGGPLVDKEGKLLGVNVLGWARLSNEGANTYYSIPVNAVRQFLSGHVGWVLAPERNTLPIFDKEVLENLPASPDTSDADGERLPDGLPKTAQLLKIIDGLAYGPYVHILNSREKAKLKARAGKLLNGLRGLYYRCPTCKARGTIEELVREGYRAPDGSYTSPQYRTVACPTCKGRKKLFKKAIATRAFRSYAHAEGPLSRNLSRAERDFVQRCEASDRSYTRRPQFRVEVSGRFGVVHGATNNPLFPMHWKLQPARRGYEWHLHHDSTNGPFEFGTEDGGLPGRAKVGYVASGDTIILDDWRIVRLCGVCIPQAGNKIPKPDLATPDEQVRKLVHGELTGRMVGLASDKYATVTADGHPIAFFELDGKDYGEELLRRGIARLHPKHKHRRYGTYKKAESEARKAKLGIWAE